MPEITVRCPHCGQEFALSDAVSRDIEKRLTSEYNQKYKAAIDAKERELRDRLNAERSSLEQSAKARAEEFVSTQMRDLQSQLSEKRQQLEASHNLELDLRKRQRELEERERTMQLGNERRLDEERKKIWNEASERVADEQRMKIAEKEKQLSDAQRQVEELHRKLELTSQQSQGEVQEIELESVLKNQFRYDSIEPVPKGMRGADVVQQVRDENGRSCGSIVWESKRTKAWGGDWIQKLKDDQRASKSDVAVIVSTVLPKEIQRFGYLDGVWVTDFASAAGLASALRINLMQLAYARNMLANTNDKKDLIYSYLTSTAFQQRVEAIAESAVSMQRDLDSEKRAMDKIWSKREVQIRRILMQNASLHGDLEGIIGTALPEVRQLTLPEADAEGAAGR